MREGMGDGKEGQTKFADLRRRARMLLNLRGETTEEDMSWRDVRELVHELDTYQIELELQNEELRKTTGELEKARKKYSDLYDFAPVGYLTLSLKGLILEANLTAAGMLGRVRADMFGQPFSAYVVPADQDSYYRCRRRLEASGGSQSCEVHLRKKDGKVFPATLDFVISPELDLENDQFRISVTDISRLKEMEEELFQARNLETVGVLAGGVAHDFNNILSSILGFAELAREGVEDGSPAAGDIDEVIVAGLRAKELVEKLLTYSRRGPKVRIRLAPAAIVAESVRLFKTSLPESISLIEDIDRGCGTLRADPNHIRQIVVQLAANALHAMGKGPGTLKVSLKRRALTRDEVEQHPRLPPGPFIELAVSDTGCGMDEATRRKIFEPFFTTRGVGQGSGLGLSAIHGIVTDMGGFIDVTSRPGRGTTMRIFLPAG